MELRLNEEALEKAAKALFNIDAGTSQGDYEDQSEQVKKGYRRDLDCILRAYLTPDAIKDLLGQLVKPLEWHETHKGSEWRSKGDPDDIKYLIYKEDDGDFVPCVIDKFGSIILTIGREMTFSSAEVMCSTERLERLLSQFNIGN